MIEVDDSLFKEILSKSQSQYFFHKDDTGRIELVFETTICKIDPGEEDLAGRIWDPKLTDADGNPRLDKNGNPIEPWTTYQAKVNITKAANATDIGPKVYSFGGERSPQLREFIKAVVNMGFSSKDLPGTKWEIEKIGQWDWDVKYVGKEESNPPAKPTESIDKNIDVDFDKIKSALAVKKDQGNNGITKDNLLVYLSFVLNKKSEEIEKILPDLLSRNLVKLENGLYYIL